MLHSYRIASCQQKWSSQGHHRALIPMSCLVSAADISRTFPRGQARVGRAVLSAPTTGSIAAPARRTAATSGPLPGAWAPPPPAARCGPLSSGPPRARRSGNDAARHRQAMECGPALRSVDPAFSSCLRHLVAEDRAQCCPGLPGQSCWSAGRAFLPDKCGRVAWSCGCHVRRLARSSPAHSVDGTLENRAPRPSTIIGCAMMASRSPV